jgi:hypothetical protein
MAAIVKKYIKRSMIVFMVFMHTLCSGGQPPSARPTQGRDAVIDNVYSGGRGDSTPLSPVSMKVVSALEARVGDRQLLEKIRKKLAGLSNEDLKLIASLCAGIPAEGRTAQSDIAFLLATALVILS